MASSDTRRFVPLLVMFIGSGCAALVYEVVWFQMLELVLGSSAVSLGVLLGTFMGGMGLGSLMLIRFIPPRVHPLRAFACIEAGIGVCGLGVLLLAPLVARVYVAAVGHGLPGILLRGAAGAACLAVPTLLMGATLPVIGRWVESTPLGVSRLGWFYAGNLAGAVIGCLVAGFWLLRLYDTTTATFFAVGVNWLVAALGFGLAARLPHPSETARNPEIQAAGASGAPVRAVYATIAISGFCALAAETVWTRLLSLMLGATVYTFSIILAVFLVGLGAGSGLGAALARRATRPWLALAWCQLGLTAAIAWTAYVLARSLPYWPINPSLARSPWHLFQLDMVRCAWAIFPATLLWGASFPLGLAAASPGQEPGRLVGRIYAANTFGAILGAVSCTLLLVALLGTQQAQRLLIALAGLAGLLMVVAGTRGMSGTPGKRQATPPAGGSGAPAPAGGRAAAGGYGLIAALVLAGILLLVWRVPELPWELVAYGRYLPTRTAIGTNLFTGEGLNASVSVTDSKEGFRNFHISGRVEASTDPTDMRLQRMLGHLPGLLHPQPRSVLVVGCGAGVTAGSFATYPGIKRIVICELEPLVVKKVTPYFSPQNYGVVKDPRTEVVYDDARHFVLTSREKFDIITSDPIHPWVKGAATLYTKEYLETCKAHLNAGGMVSQWAPLYESDAGVVKSEMATFFSVFPGGSVWGNDLDGSGYDLVLLGPVEPTPISAGEVQARLNREDYRQVRESLRDASLRSAFGLLATYAGHAPDLTSWLGGGEINRDGNLRLQYLAGLQSGVYQQEDIYAGLLEHRRFPGSLFVGGGEALDAVGQLIRRGEAGEK